MKVRVRNRCWHAQQTKYFNHRSQQKFASLNRTHTNRLCILFWRVNGYFRDSSLELAEAEQKTNWFQQLSRAGNEKKSPNIYIKHVLSSNMKQITHHKHILKQSYHISVSATGASQMKGLTMFRGSSSLCLNCRVSDNHLKTPGNSQNTHF